MNELLLGTVVLGLAIQDVAKKNYSRQVVGGAYSFSAGSTLVAMLFFLALAGGKVDFSISFLPYSVAFGISYSIALVFSLLAVSVGPLSLTSLVVSCSLILPTLYGLLILHEPLSAFLVVGVVLLLLSLVFINLEGKGEARQITPKWLLFALLAFLGNGGCTIIQKAQQLACDGAYKNEFMFIASLLAGVVLLIGAAFTERKSMLAHLKHGALWFGICGATNGFVNLLVMILAKELAASVMFPVISAGGIVLTFFVSVFFYKERLSKWQIIGVALGAISVVFLNF